MRLSCLALGAALLLSTLSAVGQAPDRSGKVVLVTITGASDLLVDQYLASGVLPLDGAFARLAGTGVRAEYLRPIATPETPSSIASLHTGAYPERHGIVGFFFHAAGDPLSQASISSDVPYQAETLVQAALRQGKRVMELATWPPRQDFPEQSGYRVLDYPQPLGPAAVVELEPDPKAQPAEAPAGVEHLQQLRARGDEAAPVRFEFFSGDPITVRVLAADTTADGVEHYDSLLFDFDAELSNAPASRLRPGEWAAVPLPVEGQTVSSWVRLLEPTEDLTRARLFLSSAVVTRGYPTEFIETLRSELGPVPAGPDRLTLSLGLAGERIGWEQRDRSFRYFRDVARYSFRHLEFDLLIVPLSLDGVGHFFYLRHPRRPEYASEAGARRQRYAAYVEHSYQEVDRTLRELLASAPPGTNFVVVSDHGMMSAHTQLRLNTALAQAGFHLTEDDTSELFAYSGGNTAHIYVNLAGREPNGVVPTEKLDGTVARLVAACRALRDPETGEPVFDVVAKRAELGQFRMGHEKNAGDVWVVARPGYVLNHQLDSPGPVWQPYPGPHGLHGYLGSYREIQGVFFAAGPEIPHRYLGAVDTVDVAPTVSALLGIAPPAQSQGRDALARPAGQ